MVEYEVSGNIVDIIGKRIFQGIISVSDGRIIDVREAPVTDAHFILPGFIDAHVHIESSMLPPSEFARLAVVHGTVATVSDPHEIANVMGIEGVKFMVENGKITPFKFYFGVPSCVPATGFETAGAEISPRETELLFKTYDLKYLAEMMNWPGVLYDDKVVFEKIEIAKKYGKPIDGHAPGLKGKEAEKYISSGISTDHECFTIEEALDKLSYGMKILIREGSAAKNFEALIDLLRKDEYVDHIMFCSDDKHPDNLVEGHINLLVKRAISKGIDVFRILNAACINPVKHYGLEVGLLKKGDPADFIIVDNLTRFNVLKTYINGAIVAENGLTNIPYHKTVQINQFHATLKNAEDFQYVSATSNVLAIVAMDGQLITKSEMVELPLDNGLLKSSVEKDILKITVVNRYQDSQPAVAFIKGFGLKSGALASSIAHDSHNIIAVGVDDISIRDAVNEVIRNKGGISVVHNNKTLSLPLSIAGLMSEEDGYVVAEKYTALDEMSKKTGSTLSSPFMTLSFMALLVIPSLKLSDRGLFDGEKFKFV